MHIENVTQALTAELRKLDPARKAEKEQKATTRTSLSSDKSEISASGKSLSATKSEQTAVSAQIAAQPEVRMDRVNDVKEKLKRGYYDSPEFTDKLADKLMAQFGITNPQK